MKKSTVVISQDKPVELTSTKFGANINVTAFNVDYIAQREPELVTELYKLYEKAKSLQKKKPIHRFEERFSK